MKPKFTNKSIIIFGISGSITVIFLIYFSLLPTYFLYLSILVLIIIISFFTGAQFEKNKKITESGKIKNVKLFKTSMESRYNDEFYEYFCQKIKQATHDIYVTGEGFECNDKMGVQLATNYYSATKEALNKGIHIVRLQTKPFISEEWAKLLNNLLKDYPDKFELYVDYNFDDIIHIVSLCAIDVHDERNNLVEIMFSTNRYLGIKETDLAGLAIFIEGDSQLTKDFADRILHVIKHSKNIKRVNNENIFRMLVDKKLYFAYGSNMDENQMKKRCPSAVKIGIGEIGNYKIVFNRKGSYVNGGVASIEPAFKSKVMGIVYQINEKEFLQLDNIEDKTAYTREEMDVKLLEDSDILRCNVYKAFRQDDVAPDEEYLNSLIESAKKANLPSSYLMELEFYKK